MAWYNFIKNNRDAKAFIEYKAKADAEFNDAIDSLNKLDSEVLQLKTALEDALADGVLTKEEVASIKLELEHTKNALAQHKQYLLDGLMHRNQWRDLALYLYHNHAKGCGILPKLRATLDFEE